MGVKYRSLRDAVIADVGRAIAIATGGALAFVPVEYALALWAYGDPTPFAVKLRLVGIAATLGAVLWLGLAIALAAAVVGARLLRARIDPATARGPGALVVGPLRAGVRAGVPAVWATLVAALAFAAGLQRAAAWAIGHYKEPQLTAGLIAAAGLALAAVAVVARRGLRFAARAGAEAVAPWLGPANPLGRWRACGVALAVLVGAGLAGIWHALPQSRSVLPVRLVVSALVIALGGGLGLRYLPRRRRARRSRAHARGIAGVAFAVVVSTLLWWGGDPEARFLAITGSPAFDHLIGTVRTLNDLDRDGFGSVLGDADCAPWNAAIHPGDAVDLPDDGIDQNCDGRDFSLARLAVPAGPVVPVPPDFRRDWNFLLITIDTVRYDHTTMGGYATGSKHRDTTPRLAELAARSNSFVYAQAPSAGTMASIPAILTSKFFHSGIALDENVPRGTPPKIRPENTTLPEIMKRGGYRTGVIGSHEWWNDWGLDQGVDEYDNSIGAKPDAYRVVADKITDRAVAWISRHQGKKWFLWTHYIDPHGRYVAHPDVVDYGSSEPDLYDAELAWTDQQLGRLLDELAHLPSYANTIIVVTSDHGESMGEHHGTIGTHGYSLYAELTHVPLMFFIPGNRPRALRGAVTNLDIVPTIAAIAGIDVTDLQFEGKSLVAQLFYGREDRDRIVFAETNAPNKQRAAISERYRLIYRLSSNVKELFETAVDPGERTNLAPRDPPALATMNDALQQWMDRVLYARDPRFNQAYRQMSDVILSAAPAPPVRTEGQVIDGKLEVLGIGPADGKPWARGKTGDIHVYFHVREPTAVRYRFSLAVWPARGALTDPTPPGIQRGPARATADGAYPSDRWRAGDYIRERFPFKIPSGWTGGVAVGLIVVDARTGQRLRATGPAPANDPTIHALGVIPVPGAPAGSPGGPPP